MTHNGDPYATIAPLYDRFLERFDGPVRATAFTASAPLTGMRVLDVGCGTGVTLEQYVDAGCVCSGVDTSKAMLHQASKRLGDRVDLTLASAEHLAFEDNTFDRVLASLFLHELAPATRDVILSELARVAKPDGKIVVSDFAAGDLTLRGKMIRAVSMVIERMAGKAHKRNCVTFLASGGIPAAARQHRLAIDSSRILGGGNMGIYVLTT